MQKKIIKITEVELKNIITEAVNEVLNEINNVESCHANIITEAVNKVLNETGGFSTGISDKHLKIAKKDFSKGNTISTRPSGKSISTKEYLNRTSQMALQNTQNMLKMFANKDFLFLAQLQSGFTYIITFRVLNIVSIKPPFIRVKGIWTVENGEPIVKTIKINSSNRKVLFYNSYAKCIDELDTDTGTFNDWNIFVNELVKIVQISCL